MRDDLQEMLARQTIWQRSRHAKTWGDELRESLAVRQSVVSLKKNASRISNERHLIEKCKSQRHRTE